MKICTAEIGLRVLAIEEDASSGFNEELDMLGHDLYSLECPAILCTGLCQYGLGLHIHCSCEHRMPVLRAADDVVLQGRDRIMLFLKKLF